MNRIIKLLFIIILFISCRSSQINIETKTVDCPVIVRFAKDKPDRIITIQIPFRIFLQNNFYEEKKFLRIYYKYNDSISSQKNGGYGIDLFNHDNKKLNKVQNKKRTLKAKESLEYICYSYHFSSEKISEELKSCVQKIKTLNKDTIHIEKNNTSMVNCAKIFEKLTKNDSISIQFLDNGKLGEQITVPLEW